MPIKIPNKQKLKKLAKDEAAFKELIKLFESNSVQHSEPEKETINLFKEGLPNAFWYIKDAETNEFIFYSDSVESITGYEYSELVLMHGGILSLVDEEDLSHVKDELNQLSANDNISTINFTYRSKSKNDSILYFNTTVTAERDQNNTITLYKGITFDITSIKKSEIEITQKLEEMKRINSAKDRFISIVSHDLRTPFTSLLGFSEILLNDQELTEHERRDYLEYIHNASETQLQMVNYLLDWSKLQSGKLIPNPQRVNLKLLVNNCVSVLTGAAIRKDIDFKVDVESEYFIQADERLVIQAVTNLLSNAIKFTPPGKSVYIFANNFKEGMLELIVKDEGLGISEKNQAKLFKIDQKFSLDGTNGEKGSGLGLTLVKEIVEKHNGNIWFYSKEEEGTEFHITLPGAKNIVLIVEDEETVSQLYAMSIKKVLPDYEMLIAENGYEAIGIIMDKVPMAIVTDHSMPLMNGIQLVEALNKRYNNTIPVIVLSSFFDRELKEKYKALGATKLVNKPINLSQLGDLVKEVIVNNR